MGSLSKEINKKVVFYLLLGLLLSLILINFLPFDIVLIFMTGYFWNLILIDPRIYTRVQDRKYRFSLLKGYVLINNFLLTKLLKDTYWHRSLLPLIVFGPFLLIIEQYILCLMLVLGALAFETSAYFRAD